MHSRGQKKGKATSSVTSLRQLLIPCLNFARFLSLDIDVLAREGFGGYAVGDAD